MWKPHKNLCKRFNVPEPFGGMMFDEEEETRKKKQSSSLFDFIGIPLNTKSNFVAPQVIPRKLTEDTRQKNDEEQRRKKFLEAIEKEKSFMGAGAQRATAKDFFEGDEMKKVEDKKALEVIKEPQPPKTELEKKVADSINKKPEEKKDLFRAIFCDSDDEEEEEETVIDDSSKDESALSEQKKSKFIESFLNTKSALEINVLRNKSPPRGIFKGIFDVPSTSKRSEEASSEKQEENEFYGPQMPTNFAPPSIASNEVSVSISGSSSSDDNSDLDAKLLKKLKKSKKEKWVEKDKVKKSKKEKKKKKKSHKKHKSKH